MASIEGYLEIVKLLLEAGADVNIQDKYGITAARGAGLMGYIEIVELLENYDKQKTCNCCCFKVKQFN